jgi:glucans biosynthesis protein
VPWKTELARIAATRSGAGHREKTRLFVIDYMGDRLKALPPETKLHAEVTADKGKVANVVAQPNPESGGWRVSFELETGGARQAEMRAQLLANDEAVSEAWVFRWTP